jgi:transposase
MKISDKEYEKIANLLPVQRGNVEVANKEFLRAILYIAENGCKWRALPKEYGKWATIYKRASRWAKNGVLERVFIELQREQIIKIRVEHISIDSTSVKVHPDGHGALKKVDDRASERVAEGGQASFMWVPRMTKSP